MMANLTKAQLGPGQGHQAESHGGAVWMESWLPQTAAGNLGLFHISHAFLPVFHVGDQSTWNQNVNYNT